MAYTAEGLIRLAPAGQRRTTRAAGISTPDAGCSQIQFRQE